MEPSEDDEQDQLSSAIRDAMDRAGIDTGVYLSWRGLSLTVEQVCALLWEK